MVSTRKALGKSLDTLEQVGNGGTRALDTLLPAAAVKPKFNPQEFYVTQEQATLADTYGIDIFNLDYSKPRNWYAATECFYNVLEKTKDVTYAKTQASKWIIEHFS